MKICLMHIKGITPYSCSHYVDEEVFPKLEKETHADYDRRMWREKATYDEDGIACVPAMGLKMAIDEACKRLSLPVKEKGKTLWTKFFLAGHICDYDMPLGIHRDDLESIIIWANADGRRGGKSRVKKTFPYLRDWGGVARFSLLDPAIPIAIFERVAIEAGKLVGVGRFRPEVGGMNGRFAIEKFEWSEI